MSKIDDDKSLYDQMPTEWRSLAAVLAQKEHVKASIFTMLDIDAGRTLLTQSEAISASCLEVFCAVLMNNKETLLHAYSNFEISMKGYQEMLETLKKLVCERGEKVEH